MPEGSKYFFYFVALGSTGAPMSHNFTVKVSWTHQAPLHFHAHVNSSQHT